MKFYDENVENTSTDSSFHTKHRSSVFSNSSNCTLTEIIQDRRSGIPIKEKERFKNKIKKVKASQSPFQLNEHQANKFEKWESQDLITFFKCLKIFGTDFSMI
jgi:plasmid maintenance system killer protein